MTSKEILAIIIGTAVTVVLRWAADRWPGNPRRRRNHDRRDDEEDDR